MARINVYGNDEFDGNYLAGWFDSDKAEMIEGRQEWDGSNMADVHAGANRGQDLYRTAKGRYVLSRWSSWQNEDTTYEFVTEERAREWLLVNQSDETAEKWFGEIEEERGPGRPETVGGKPINLKLGDDLTAKVDAAKRTGESRAATVRRLLADALA